jgi:hypothetical protein
VQDAPELLKSVPVVLVCQYQDEELFPDRVTVFGPHALVVMAKDTPNGVAGVPEHALTVMEVDARVCVPDPFGIVNLTIPVPVEYQVTLTRYWLPTCSEPLIEPPVISQ